MRPHWAIIYFLISSSVTVSARVPLSGDYPSLGNKLPNQTVVIQVVTQPTETKAQPSNYNTGRKANNHLQSPTHGPLPLSVQGTHPSNAGAADTTEEGCDNHSALVHLNKTIIEEPFTPLSSQSLLAAVISPELSSFLEPSLTNLNFS